MRVEALESFGPRSGHWCSLGSDASSDGDGGDRLVTRWHDRKLAKIEARIDSTLGQVAQLVVLAVNAWAANDTATSLRACADRLDKLAWRYGRLGSCRARRRCPADLAGQCLGGARTEAAVARSIAEAVDIGDIDDARRRLKAHLEDHL